MKKNLSLFVLLSAVIFLQSCGTKSEVSNNADAEDSIATAQGDVLTESEKNDKVVAKRMQLEKASAEKEQQRLLEVVEKAKISETFKDASGKVVYNKAEIDPSFTGGEKAMKQYLRDNVKYPEEARDKGLEGTVFVNFIVDETGKVREVMASDVVGDDIDQSFKDESVRVVTAMPAWVAGRQRGKSVDVSFSIPITFQLSN